MSDDADSTGRIDNVVPLTRKVVGNVIAEVGGPVTDCTVALCIYGDDLEPNELTGLLGAKPTHAHRRGDRRRPSSQPYATGAWILDLKSASSGGPEALLDELLQSVPPVSSSVWPDLLGRFKVRASVAIYTSSWSEGFMVPAAKLAALSSIVHDIGITLYNCMEDEGDDPGDGE